MAKIKGTTVTLYEKTAAGFNDFGEPIFDVVPVQVENVLIGQPETDDIVSATDLFGKVLYCWLAIPKGDTHNWEDATVEWADAYGETHRVRTFGFPVTGIEVNLPRLPWHKKVRAEKYGKGEV